MSTHTLTTFKSVPFATVVENLRSNFGLEFDELSPSDALNASTLITGIDQSRLVQRRERPSFWDDWVDGNVELTTRQYVEFIFGEPVKPSNVNGDLWVILDSCFNDRLAYCVPNGDLATFIDWHIENIPYSDALTHLDHVFIFPVQRRLIVQYHEGLLVRADAPPAGASL
ncbi:MAG: hypothetical protein KJZ58_13965 [Flavobacteriales bacterium]|nr:hypothetical protein [Flavobacteriales bacterium]